MNTAATSDDKAASAGASKRPGRAQRVRTMAKVRSLDQLIGAHPEALRDIYCAGQPADGSNLSALKGRLLALEPLANAHMLIRPVVSVLSKHLLPWRGKLFDEGGATGANNVLGQRIFRFRAETGPSDLDGKPTLFLRYDGLGNPWPISGVVDELRTVGEGVSIGPASLQSARGAPTLLFWWGLQS